MAEAETTTEPPEVAAWLTGVRERFAGVEQFKPLYVEWAAGLERTGGGSEYAWMARSLLDVPRLLAAVETALKPHREHEGRCVTCLESCSCVGDGVASLPPDAPFATQNAMAFRSWSECTHGNEPWPCKPWRDITKALFGGSDGN
jgi:hypothetical protein